MRFIGAQNAARMNEVERQHNITRIASQSGVTRADLEEVLTELTALCRRKVAHHMPITAEDVPPDAIVQLFPGADHPELPLDAKNALVQISGIWEPPMPPNVIVTGRYSLIRPLSTSMYRGEKALFCLGKVVETSNDTSGKFVVSWLVPGMSK